MIQNIVAHVELPQGQRIDLDALYSRFCECSTYQRSIFPGLVLRPPESPIVLLIFNSGRIVCTGGKSYDDIYYGFAQMYKVLQSYIIQPTAAAASSAAIVLPEHIASSVLVTRAQEEAQPTPEAEEAQQPTPEAAQEAQPTPEAAQEVGHVKVEKRRGAVPAFDLAGGEEEEAVKGGHDDESKWTDEAILNLVMHHPKAVPTALYDQMYVLAGA